MFYKILRYVIVTLLLVGTFFSGNNLNKTVKADDVKDYQLDSSLIHAPTGKSITDATVITGETISATYKLKFPDSQKISENDKLTLNVPKELRFITTLNFDINVHNNAGEVVGTAKVNPDTGQIVVTFGDYFTRLPENKEVSLKFNLTVNDVVVTKTTPVTVTIGSKVYTFNYKKDDGTVGDYEMKYGYQDKNDPSIVKWRIILNARQDMIRGMTIVDKFGDGQTLIPETFRAVRFAKQPTPIRNEAHILTLTPIDNFSKKAIFTRNENNGITGFTIPFGDNYNWSMYIEYSTRLPEGVAVGQSVSNTLSWSATNFETRKLERQVRLESASGTAKGEKSGEVVLKAKKELVGKKLEANQFKFGLYDVNDTAKPLQTVSNNADGSINFEAIRYNDAGTYKYIIKEIIDNTSKEYKYDTREIPVTVSVKDENGNKVSTVSYGDNDATFTNSYIGVTSVKGQKIWKDDNNKEGKRPSSITIILKKTVDGKTEEVTRKDVNFINNWSYEFTDLPKVNENNKEVAYSIDEVDVPGYTKEISGTNVINSLTPEKPKDEPKKDKEFPKTSASNNVNTTVFGVLALVLLVVLKRKNKNY